MNASCFLLQPQHAEGLLASVLTHRPTLRASVSESLPCSELDRAEAVLGVSLL